MKNHREHFFHYGAVPYCNVNVASILAAQESAAFRDKTVALGLNSETTAVDTMTGDVYVFSSSPGAGNEIGSGYLIKRKPLSRTQKMRSIALLKVVVDLFLLSIWGQRAYDVRLPCFWCPKQANVRVSREPFRRFLFLCLVT